MAPPLKDMVDGALVEDLATRVAAVADGFDVAGFTTEVVAALPALELKQRVEAIASCLFVRLEGDYAAKLDVVVAVARAEPPIDGFAAWPLATFIEVFGLDRPVPSLAAMEHVTKRASCEFAIRPFLRDHFEVAYATLEEFTAHDDPSVRRLPSEGTRPLLPWASRVPSLLADPGPGLALVEKLRHDPDEAVRRSVANHLNDVAKDHPDLVVEIAGRWSAEQPPVDPGLVKHALRTLVKRGHPGAMEVLGFTTDAAIEVREFAVLPHTVTIGERIELVATLRSTGNATQHVVVDFVIHHVTARGGGSPKVFKWTTLDVEPGGEVSLRKRRMIQHASTRTYYPGEHRVDLQVAGRVVASGSFVLQA